MDLFSVRIVLLLLILHCLALCYQSMTFTNFILSIYEPKPFVIYIVWNVLTQAVHLLLVSIQNWLLLNRAFYSNVVVIFLKMAPNLNVLFARCEKLFKRV